MLHVTYAKVIPYPFAVVLDQYFDWEHIAHVHPNTLGEYVVVENRGAELTYDQIWPADRRGRRARSRVVQRYRPPGEITFTFVDGRHRGIVVRSSLEPDPAGTRVVETYGIPGLPDWPILRRLALPWVRGPVDRVWDEDLAVGVCIGGWPGIPERERPAADPSWRAPLRPGAWPLGSASSFPEGVARRVETPGGPVLAVRTGGVLRALAPTCPHTGGPLALGRIDDGCVVCPWHGARFDLETGRACAGPVRIPLPVYTVEERDGEATVRVEAPEPDVTR